MPAEPPKQRLLRLLLRTSQSRPTPGERSAADDSALWSAHERAMVRARDAGSAAQRIGATATRQRATIDAVADRSHALSSRVAEIQASFARVLDSFERLALIALNAGLEGARIGESEGRQLSLVSDEVRAQSARGGDAMRDLATTMSNFTTELAQLESNVGQAQAVVGEVAQDAARAAGAASDAESALADVGDRVKKATGSDPDAVRAIAEVTEKTRALVASLASLKGKVPRALLASALKPALDPLARLLSDDERAGEGDGESS